MKKIKNVTKPDAPGARCRDRKPEVRSCPVTELRTETVDGVEYLTGYAAVFGVPSAVLGSRVKFREVIQPGAFKRALSEKQDVIHTIDHKVELLLGRTTAGTTTLFEDAKGLGFRTKLGNRSYEKDLVESIARGDKNECSFRFIANGEKSQRWYQDPEDRSIQRRDLLDVDLLDVSIVSNPAYPGTSAHVDLRSLFPEGLPAEVRSGGAAKLEDGERDECNCGCLSCSIGECELCSNQDCTDANCTDCPMQNTAKPAEDSAPVNLAELSVASKRNREFIAAAKADAAAQGAEFRSAMGADGTLEIMAYGYVGEDFWSGGGITALGMKSMIDANPACNRISLRINSTGGDAFEGIAIGNLLKSCGKPIDVYVDGIAASAASVIAMCGDKIHMANNAMMMIHNASSMAWGYANDLRKEADILDKISGSVAQTYVDRTKMGKKAVTEMMDAETWMNCHDCIEKGFADEIVGEGDQDLPLRALQMICESRMLPLYKNFPKDKFKMPETPTVNNDAEERERILLRAKLMVSEAR